VSETGQDPTTPAIDHEPLDTAWRIHAAVADWTGKVDSKASFCFAIESAALVAVINLKADGRVFDDLHGAGEQTSFFVGVALLTAGILSAVWVVIPRLRRRHLTRAT